MIKKLIFKIFKWLFILTIGLFVLLATATIIFVNMTPQIGQKPQGADLERIKQSANYSDDKFINLIETQMGSFKESLKVLPDFIFNKKFKPNRLIPVNFENGGTTPTDSTSTITWYGHSAFLIEIEGKRILIDPMLGPNSSPVSFIGPRFKYEKPIPIHELTNIDAIIISHDHYDHLDYQTIKKLKKHTKHYFVPLGVGSHLKSWGIPQDKIAELDWWESAALGNIDLVACPARHFSGRGFIDRDATLWASWVITGEHQNLYFSGDGGYGPHFKEIGDKYGPFDLAMMECGQYNKAWKDIHMMPEESVQAGLDVKGKLLMPIHWGAFQLSVHHWTDPIERFKAESLKKQIQVIHPIIGDRFQLGKEFPKEDWWLDI